MANTLVERAAQLGLKLLGKLFEDPKRAEAVANAVGALQEAKRAADELQTRAMKAAGLVTSQDFKAAGKRISALKRRCRELTDELDALLDDARRP